MTERPFWETKSLAEMSPSEWESLCDGCGLCCLVRFEDEVTGEIIPTRVHCKLFDPDACRCTNYEDRHRHVPDCIKLTPGNIEALGWMPKSCAYRRLWEGKQLPRWHPLITGDPESHAPRGDLRARPDDLGAFARRSRGRLGFRSARPISRSQRRLSPACASA